jgi:hypothetical protein
MEGLARVTGLLGGPRYNQEFGSGNQRTAALEQLN